METSAAKRRKLSPRGAVSDAPDKSTTPPEPPSRRVTRSQRPSFASPTKASLARHNPDILEKRKDSPLKKSSTQGEPAPQSPTRPESRGSQISVSAALTSQLERQSEADVANSSAEKRRTNGHAQDTPVHPSNPPQSSEGRRGTGLSARPRRSSAKPNPRPLPPPGPDEDEDILNPYLQRGAHRVKTGVLPEVVVPEPELPPTPEHPDPAFTSSLSGIHNTPSKRLRRSKAFAERIRSSPSKKVTSSPAPITQRGKADLLYDPSSFGFASQPASRPHAQHAQKRPNPRGLIPVDPDKAKKKQRDDLLAEIRSLESDLRVAAAENERTRPGNLPEGLEQSRGSEKLVDILARRTLPPERRSRARGEPAWLRTALNPVAFLPLAKAASELPSLFADDDDEEQDELAPPVSHHPVAMTAEEALPYLQSFTKLSFTSNIEVLPRKSPDATLLQKHIISVSSFSPGLFAAGMEMIVDTKTHKVTSLSVPRLEQAATSELEPFIERITHRDTARYSSALTNNASVLSWAMGEWLRVAQRRARLWCHLQKELGSDDDLVKSVARLRVARASRRKRKASHHSAGLEEGSQMDDQAVDGLDGGPDIAGTAFEAADLLPHMGRMSMDINIPDPAGSARSEKSCLRVQWKIDFDWTGDAKSKIGALISVAGKWRNVDDRGTLARLPDLFNKLVQGDEDVVSAVRTVVALLAGERKGT